MFLEKCFRLFLENIFTCFWKMFWKCFWKMVFKCSRKMFWKCFRKTFLNCFLRICFKTLFKNFSTRNIFKLFLRNVCETFQKCLWNISVGHIGFSSLTMLNFEITGGAPYLKILFLNFRRWTAVVSIFGHQVHPQTRHQIIQIIVINTYPGTVSEACPWTIILNFVQKRLPIMFPRIFPKHLRMFPKNKRFTKHFRNVSPKHFRNVSPKHFRNVSRNHFRNVSLHRLPVVFPKQFRNISQRHYRNVSKNITEMFPKTF